MDVVVDRCTLEDLWALREEGKFAGVALAIDESPPSQPRVLGFRFPMTVMYWGTFLLVEDGRVSQPSYFEEILLGRHDIMHCPGKKGVGVLQCL